RFPSFQQDLPTHVRAAGCVAADNIALSFKCPGAPPVRYGSSKPEKLEMPMNTQDNNKSCTCAPACRCASNTADCACGQNGSQNGDQGCACGADCNCGPACACAMLALSC